MYPPIVSQDANGLVHFEARTLTSMGRNEDALERALASEARLLLEEAGIRDQSIHIEGSRDCFTPS